MLLCSHACQRLEPVGIVGGSPLNCPVLHGMGNHIRNTGVQLCPVFNGFLQLLVHTLWQTVPHHRVIEYIFTEHLRYIQYIAHRIIHPLFLSSFSKIVSQILRSQFSRVIHLFSRNYIKSARIYNKKVFPL